MPKYVGVWMDQKGATLATFSNGTEKMERIASPVERWHKATGGSRGALPYVFNGGGASGKEYERHDHEIKKYYDSLIRNLQDADQIYIMGPGLAKKAFVKEVEKNKKLAKKIAGIMTVGRLTDRQVASKVRGFFKIVRD